MLGHLVNNLTIRGCYKVAGHIWSLLITAGHSWSQLVTTGHKMFLGHRWSHWSHPWLWVGHYKRDISPNGNTHRQTDARCLLYRCNIIPVKCVYSVCIMQVKYTLIYWQKGKSLLMSNYDVIFLPFQGLSSLASYVSVQILITSCSAALWPSGHS